ncbi:MAG: hypothetical protein DDT32_00057 [Syntrophomonadaceae bacterium]|nr:hypothetical protein [Bacillota bacterium]MBT9146331.1 hypothetical protein [Bacillota bacterium]
MVKKVVIGLVLLSIVLLQGGSAFSSEPLPEEFNILLRESLERGGQMMILERAEPKRVHRIGSILIDAPPEKVWEVLTDFERWSEFVPMMRSSKIVQTKEDTVTVDFTLAVRFLMIPFSSSYTTIFRPEKPKLFIRCPEKSEETGFYGVLSVGEKTLLIISEQAPDLEEMGGLIAAVVRGVPGAELAFTLSPQAILLEAIKERAEGG